MLTLAGYVAAVGVRLSSRVQMGLALTLTVGLLTAAAASLVNPRFGLSVQTPNQFDEATALGATVGAVFFAFTGWEMISFTTEEYRNPRRDFPRVVIISFVLVTAMYLLLAAGLQAQLPQSDQRLATAPVEAMVAGAVGPVGALLVGLLGVIIILANLIGATWGASRLVMSSSREGLLPTPLARVDPATATPRNAIAACVTLFQVVLAATAVGLFPLTELLSIAGRNFFILYLVSAVVYVKLLKGRARAFGLVVATALAIVTLSFGAASWTYALLLFIIGSTLSTVRRRVVTPVGVPSSAGSSRDLTG